MRAFGGVTVRGAAAIALGLLSASARIAHGGSISLGEDVHQTVIVVSARSVIDHSLPAAMQIESGRFLAAREVERACASASPTASSALLYFPASKRCEPVSDQDLISLRYRLQKITGRRQPVDPLLQAREEHFVAITPPRPVPGGHVLAMCGCSVDQPPTGVSMCAAQTRTEGAPIGSVEFLATDPDSPTLTGQFSYQRDSDLAEPGLPPELTSSCTSGSGTLQCTLTGTAPAPAGILQFSFDVSDGTFSIPLETRLEVLAVGERIFSNNFEVAGCP